MLAQRITYVGELGFELYVERDWAVQVWDRLVAAGGQYGMSPGGYRVLDSLRLEKGYRYFGTDLTAGDNPLEAGLDFCVAWDKDFTGRAALEGREPERRLRTLLVGDESYETVYGGEAIHADGAVVGRVRSAGYGFTVGRNVALGYVPAGLEEGAELGIEVFGELVPAEVARDTSTTRRTSVSVASCRACTRPGESELLMAWELASFSADLLGDASVEGADVEIVLPGSPVRVTHVLDAVEPRVRPDGRAAFPREGKAGEGRTNRLDGVVVLSCLDFPAEERPLHEQESIVDLAGPGRRRTPRSRARPASS